MSNCPTIANGGHNPAAKCWRAIRNGCWITSRDPPARVAFPVWKHWTKDDPLMESGLLGPVRIMVKARAVAK